MNTYDVVIIGAGVVGASIARELSRYELSIAVLEKEEEPAFGVSKSNSGIIHPGTQNLAGSLKGRLCLEGNVLIRQISRELGLDFKETGELIVAFSQDEIPRLLEIKLQAEALGVGQLRIVDKAWLRDNEPNLNPEAVSALYAPTAGIISPYRLVYALCENALKNGVEIYTQTKVENIIFTDPCFEIQAVKGAFKSKHVINASGLSADEISAMLGISDFKITPRKGQEFILDKKKENLSNHLLFPLPSKVSKGILVIKTADGNPMIGPSAEEVEDKEDLSTTGEGLKKVFEGARRLVPSLNQEDIIAYFSGLRPVSGDDFIIRYEDKVSGFINIAGIQSPGLTAAPAIARMVCDILKEKGLKLEEKEDFIRERKKPIHLFNIPLSQTEELIKQDAGYGDIVCRCELVSAKEVENAIASGAKTLDGIKFRTRAQAGRCHGSFCTTRLMKILSEQTHRPLREITKRGPGSEIIKCHSSA
ncbi:MAG: NAD(P)/FAD-dependent oxidoreductase [Candidatus Omnitrophota bacterium]